MNINIETNTTQTLTTKQIDILARDLCGVIITLSDTGVPKYNFTTTGISATCENVHQESVDALRLKGINVTYTNSCILFKDPEVVRVLTGRGIIPQGGELTTAQAAVANFGFKVLFQNNTVVKNFDELRYFDVYKTAASAAGAQQIFDSAENLESVDLTGIKSTNLLYAFRKCHSLEWYHGKSGPKNVLNLE